MNLPAPLQVRRLTGADASRYFELRLRALREHPEAFATSYEEARERSLDEVAERLAPSSAHVTLGMFRRDDLVGIVTARRFTGAKTRHRATITAMYVTPAARGTGTGRSLLRSVLDACREWDGVQEVSLFVTVGNLAARALYVGEGFEPCGIEPRSLRVGDQFYDVELLNLNLAALDGGQKDETTP